MSEYRFDCDACTNKAYSQRFSDEFGFDAYYCLPQIATGKSPLVLHDMGGSKHGDYMTCDGYTTEPRPLAIYETVSVFNAEHPCNEPSDWGER